MTTNLMPAEGIHWAPVPQWTTEALYDSGAGVATQAAFLAFWAVRDRKTGVARMSRTELAKRLRVSEPTARRAIRELERLGLVRRENTATGGRGAWARYFVALDAPHLYPYRANPQAPVTTVRGPRAGVPRGAPKGGHARPLVPSVLPDSDAVENPVTNPVTTPEKGVTTNRVSAERGSPRTGFRAERGSPRTGTRHLEVKQKQQQMRAQGETGGGTPVRDVAAAANGTPKNPVITTTDVPAAAQESRAGNAAGVLSGFSALAELREAIGARGVLPMTAEAEARVRVWFDAGWTADTLAEHLAERMRIAGHVATPPGFVLTVLRDEPGRPPAAPRPVVDEGPVCDTCGRVERACRLAAVRDGDPHPFKAKAATKRAGVEQLPTTSPVRPPDGLAAPDLGVLAEQVQELLEQALEGLPPDIQTFARTGS